MDKHQLLNVRIVLVCLFVFLSGLCALVFQLAWLREFRLVFGATTLASAAVLAIFMGGLGVGAAVLGKRVDRQPNPLGFYGLLVLLIGLAAMASPYLISTIRFVYTALGGQMVLGGAGATAVRLVLSALVLGVPTILMGGTLPAAARAVTTRVDIRRRYVGLLYGINTLGAVVGAGLCTFYMLEIFGTRFTVWAASLVNILVGVCAIVLSRRFLQPVSVTEPLTSAYRSPAHPADKNSENSLEPAPESVRPTFIYAAAGVVGFAFFLMELVWYRMLAPVFGSTTYAFGLILMVALAGIGLGGAAYPLIFRYARVALRNFALTCALEAACLSLPYALGDRVAVLAGLLRVLSTFGFLGEILGWTIVASIIIFPAAFVSGIQFPLLIALLGRSHREVGRHVGLGYAWNTVGAIFGALAGGFWLLPWLTAPVVWRAVAILLVTLAVVALVLSMRMKPLRFRLLAPSGALALALLFLNARGPTAAWRHSEIGSGLEPLSSLLTANEMRSWLHDARRRVVWEAEGIESSIAILKPPSGLSFCINGKIDGNARLDAPTSIMLGLLGALLHPEPKTALVVGLGTGQTAGWLAEVQSMERVDVVEIEPAINEVARRCAVINKDVLSNQRVRRIYNDAREVLMTVPEHYDLIVSEPSHLYRAGTANLYTREFYQSVSKRLNEDGLFVQWLQAYWVDTRTVRMVLATLASVFPYVEVWQSKPRDMLLVCSKKPVEYPIPSLRRRIQEEPFASALARAWWTHDLEGVLARYIAGPAIANRVKAQERGQVNSDDRNLVEYRCARALGRDVDFTMIDLRDSARVLGAHRPPIENGAVDWKHVEDQRLQMYIMGDIPVPVQPHLTPAQCARAEALDKYGQGDMFGVVAMWKTQSREPLHVIEILMLAHAHTYFGDEEALPLLRQLDKVRPNEASALMARYLWNQGKTEEAVDALVAAFHGFREDPWPARSVIGDAFELAQAISLTDSQLAIKIYESLEQPFALSLQDESRKAVAIDVAFGLGPSKQVEMIETFEPFVPWERKFLELRSQVYRATNHPFRARAEAELQEYRAHAGQSFPESLR